MYKAGEWKQELIFIKRDEKGVIIAMSEQTPKGYVEKPGDPITESTRFRVVGD